ncbi:MAG: hypothetical protein ACSHYB_03275 [Roseibacillus sp.]
MPTFLRTRHHFLLLALVATAGAIEPKVRPVFDNLVTEPGDADNPFIYTGLTGNPNLATANSGNYPNDGVVFLEEFSVGQSFAPYTPFEDYAKDEADRIRTFLYPAPTASKTQVESSSAAFRYLTLLYSPEPGETDVTSHFQQMDTWYGEPERLTTEAAIDDIWAALANAPLDSGLRNLLLDAYTDRAVAEVQFIKNDLVELGKKRLGLEVVSVFVIDEEIEILERVTGTLKTIIDQYTELFTERQEGVEPSDFDPSATPGTPFGYYIFQKQQPSRNQTPSRYFEATTGEPEPVPTYNENTQSVEPRASNEILASGFKDYVTLITIMGDYVEHVTELNRLRGLRQLPPSSQNPSDLELARAETAEIFETFPNDLSLLRSMFADHDFPAGDTSGVYAAFTGAETALADLTNIRSFLNGTSNMLGLDPNFLILFQTQFAASPVAHNGDPLSLPNFGGFDSFSQFVARLRGPNRPLTVALGKYDDARDEYENFRESVDQVVEDLKAIRVSREVRFRDITGYSIGIDDDQWNGKDPKPGVGSELERVELDLELLGLTQGEIENLQAQFEISESEARVTLNFANGLDDYVDDARRVYADKVDGHYLALQIGRPVGAAAQAVQDTAFQLTSLKNPLTAKFKAIAISAAGATNGAAQAILAGIEADAEVAIDQASISYEGKMQKADNELTVQQSKDALQDLLRERYSANIEGQEVSNGITQATARRTALYLELDRIEQTFETNTAAVRSRYYADPIHFIRSQNAILDADAAFAEAQRWMFYAQRALEHKWTQRFGVTSGGKDYDSGSVFKMRNVTELDDLLTAFLAFDAAREPNDSPIVSTAIISLKDDLLARNPNTFNLTNVPESDPSNDLRVDLTSATVVSQLDLFRNKLRSYQTGSGSIVVPFNTALLQDIESLFRGPEYNLDGSIGDPGQWRDKIIYVKFNIVAEDGPDTGPGGTTPTIINGAVGYGGLTIFRTRLAPRSDPNLRLVPASNASTFTAEVNPGQFVTQFTDYPGEFFVQPYRFYQSENLDNVFQVLNENLASGSIAYSGNSARFVGFDPTQEDTLGQTFQFNNFNELSVAATRWRLVINATQPNLSNQAIDIDKIEDIELIIRHRAATRVSSTAN